MISKINHFFSDIKFLFTALIPIKMKLIYLNVFKNGKWTIADLWDNAVKKFPNNVALIYKNKKWTYKELDILSDHISLWILSKKLKPRSYIGIWGENTPEFIWHVIGLIKIGFIPVILRPSSNEEQMSMFLRGYDKIPLLIIPDDIWKLHCNETAFKRFEQVEEYKKVALTDSLIVNSDFVTLRKDISMLDDCFHLGTSGTGKFSKAIKSHHGSLLVFAHIHKLMKKLRKEDIIYCCVTMSHGDGLAVAITTSWSVGAAVYLDDHFDVMTFFKTCSENNITVIQYIGTKPRALLRTPEGPYDKNHRIRVASGHEMIPSVWLEFKKRFNIKDIAEYYASSEGTVGFLNLSHKVGAVGFVGPITRLIYPFAIVKLDENDNIIKKNGKPVLCKRGEVGELLGLINQTDPLNQMNDYVDESLNSERTIKSFFKPDDHWYCTGDLISHGEDGYIRYFGRLGSSIKINDELYVSPQQIEDKILKIPYEDLGITDCYSAVVCLKDKKQKKPIAFLNVSKKVDLSRIYEIFSLNLMDYEIPMYIVFVDTPFAYTESHRLKRHIKNIDETNLESFHNIFKLNKSKKTYETFF